MNGVESAVRDALLRAEFHESEEPGDPGFRVWPSKRTPGLIYVDVRLSRDHFAYSSTPRWGKRQIAEYVETLKSAGFVVRPQERIPVPRLAVRRPEEHEAQGGPDHG